MNGASPWYPRSSASSRRPGSTSSSKRGAGAGAVDPRLGLRRGRRERSSRPTELYDDADVILRVQKPSAAEIAQLRQGQTVIGLLQPLIDPKTGGSRWRHGASRRSASTRCPARCPGPRRWTRCRSQANVGGYKAVLIAATAYGRYFPLLTTAAGTAKPANVLVLGIGVAGLQAIATARRLGAVVKAYDVRSETKEQAESLGAQFLVLKSLADATGAGGYARELTPEEQAAQQAELNGFIGGDGRGHHHRPGARPAAAGAGHRGCGGPMKPGSVIVDMAASALGGNVRAVEAGRDDRHRQRRHDHRPGPTCRPRCRPARAAFYARNISALLLHFVKDGAMNLRLRRRDHGGTVITHDGAVVQAATAKLLDSPPAAPAGSTGVRRGRPGRPAHEPGAAQRAGASSCSRSWSASRSSARSRLPCTRPLMSGANSIHGIVLVGGMLIAAEADNPLSYLLAFVAMVFGATNVVGGYVVTDRMLQMFRKKPTAAAEGAASDQAEGQERRCHSSGSTPSSIFAWLVGAACFVLGLHQMNSPATARNGNRLSAGGHDVAVVATLV